MRPAPSRGARAPSAQRGFTLVEAIVVIVIIGILSGIVGLFIRLPVQNYVDSAARAEMSDIADLTLRRLSREVRLALPNSVRVSGGAVEFIATKTGGRYLGVEDGLDTTTYPVLDFVNPGNVSFTVVGAMPAAPQAIAVGDAIVVYNLGPGFDPADAYGKGNLAQVSAVSGNLVTLASNPFASASPTMASPGRRFQVVTGPVMYVCDLTQQTLRRYSNYALTSSMAVPPAGASNALLATNVSSCTFNYSVPASTHSALLGVSIGLTRPNTSESVTLSHQVHVDNVP